MAMGIHVQYRSSFGRTQADRIDGYIWETIDALAQPLCSRPIRLKAVNRRALEDFHSGNRELTCVSAYVDHGLRHDTLPSEIRHHLERCNGKSRPSEKRLKRSRLDHDSGSFDEAKELSAHSVPRILLDSVDEVVGREVSVPVFTCPVFVAKVEAKQNFREREIASSDEVWHDLDSTPIGEEPFQRTVPALVVISRKNGFRATTE